MQVLIEIGAVVLIAFLIVKGVMIDHVRAAIEEGNRGKAVGAVFGGLLMLGMWLGLYYVAKFTDLLPFWN